MGDGVDVHDGGRRDALDVLSMWRGRSNSRRVASQPHFSLHWTGLPADGARERILQSC
jgi:hypothetical protein